MRNPIFHISTMLTMAIVALLPSSLVSGQEDVDEYQVKAAVLGRLMSFVNWPESEVSEALKFCVVGNNPFASNLFESSPIIIDVEQIAPTYEQLNQCQIVYISDSEIRNYDVILNTIKGESILSISDMPRFCLNGGMINLTFENRRVGFRINKNVADSANLNLSFQLLNLAEIVETESGAW